MRGSRRHRVTTGTAALDAEGYDLVLLDLGMPDMDGFDDLPRAARRDPRCRSSW